MLFFVDTSDRFFFELTDLVMHFWLKVFVGTYRRNGYGQKLKMKNIDQVWLVFVQMCFLQDAKILVSYRCVCLCVNNNKNWTKQKANLVVVFDYFFFIAVDATLGPSTSRPLIILRASVVQSVPQPQSSGSAPQGSYQSHGALNENRWTNNPSAEGGVLQDFQVLPRDYKVRNIF